MKRTPLILFTLLFSATISADNFITQFMNRYAEENRPLNNVNIGEAMLDKMSENTEDEELKIAFKELNSIQIVSSENEEDSKYYLKKANELIKESFSDYKEVVSVNENMSMFLKKQDEDRQELILFSLDEDGKLTIISMSGKIDFNSMSKLSGSLKNEGVTGVTVE